VKGALRAGVDAYLLKSDTRVELGHALRAMREGNRYVSPSLSGHSNDSYGARTPPVTMEALSDRERLVMTRIAQGHRTREIATELSLSTKTIEKYRSNLMRKLGLKTAAAVAAFAIANGYVEL
jgi:DNA-binding NarL/FixJ family response regulator